MCVMLVGDVGAQLNVVVEFFFTFITYVMRYFSVHFRYVNIKVGLVNEALSTFGTAECFRMLFLNVFSYVNFRTSVKTTHRAFNYFVLSLVWLGTMRTTFVQVKLTIVVRLK